MTLLNETTFAATIERARFAPSVHNIQPTRWRLKDGAVELLGDASRAIPIADPEARDWRLSHGAAFEGFAMALNERGLAADALQVSAERALSPEGPLESIATFKVIPGAERKPDAAVEGRMTYRGEFLQNDEEAQARAEQLAAAADDLHLVRAPSDISHIADLGDEAGLFFLRDGRHREELLEWMRLSKKHPNYHRDGLNAEAMQLSAFEAFGAGLTLGPLFSALDRFGLLAPLVSEKSKTKSAAAIVLFYRPRGEDPFISGRAFYRAWLAIEKAGLKTCPISVIADWEVTRNAIAEKFAIPQDRRIVSVLRIGSPKASLPRMRARLAVPELIAPTAG